MKRRLIAHGNTYCGRSGYHRTVTTIDVDRFGSTYVRYRRSDGSVGICYMRAFQSWATGFFNPTTEEQR